jgi:hypothetical protein
MPTFQLVGLEHTQFIPLFNQTDAELRSQGIVREQATTQPGYPCRVSLEDAAIGDELLLLPFWHHRVDSPYRSLGPIYIRQGAIQASPPPGVIPDCVARRVISLRAYNDAHMMVSASVCLGNDVASQLIEQFENLEVSYIHLHNAKQGCFSCLANRASGP